MKVYLAGPITGQSYVGASEWRDTARAALDKYDIVSYSPMRAKEALAARKELSAWDYADGNGPMSSRTMVRRDLNDVRTADIMLVNFKGATQISAGTMAELGFAHALGKYVVVVMDDMNPHRHIFVHEMASVIFPTLDEALFWITDVMNV